MSLFSFKRINETVHGTSRESTKGNRIVALCRANDIALLLVLVYKGGQQVSGWNGRWKVTLKLPTLSDLVDISSEVARQQTVATRRSFPKIYRPANPTA